MSDQPKPADQSPKPEPPLTPPPPKPPEEAPKPAATGRVHIIGPGEIEISGSSTAG